MVVCLIQFSVMPLLAKVMKVRYSYGVNLLSRADTAIALPPSSDADETAGAGPRPVSPSSKSKQRNLIDLPEPHGHDLPDAGKSSRLALHSRSTSLTNHTVIFAEPSSSSLQP